MLKKYMKMYIFSFLMIALLLAIFLFSAQEGKFSYAMSKILQSELSNLGIFKFIFSVFPIRKLAHFIIFLALGCMTYFWTNQFKKKRFINSIYSALICVACATCDELHQIFVKGRQSRFTDVLLDVAGSVFGILLCICIEKFVSAKKRGKLNI